MCQEDGQWSGTESVCQSKLKYLSYIHFTCFVFPVVDCNSLSGIVNGRATYSETVFGSSATYSCDSGFLLIGDNTRVCQEDGQWSGEEPVCVGKLRNYFFKVCLIL